jgi:predicted aconitase with swiveling domain
MRKITLKGRKVHGGAAEGVALVTRESMAGYGAFDIRTGAVVEVGHDLYGKSISGKILVFKTGKGSSAWSIGAQALRFSGKSPKALIVSKVNPQVALGSVVMRVPAIVALDQDPTEVISTGDWVKVDADRGLVEIIKET